MSQLPYLPEEPTEGDLISAIENADDVLYAWASLVLNKDPDEMDNPGLFFQGVERLFAAGRIISSRLLKDDSGIWESQYHIVPDNWRMTQNEVRKVVEYSNGSAVSMVCDLVDERIEVRKGIIYADHILTGLKNVDLSARMLAVLDPDEIFAILYASTVVKRDISMGRNLGVRVNNFFDLVHDLNTIGYSSISPSLVELGKKFSHGHGKQRERLKTVPEEDRRAFLESFEKDYDLQFKTEYGDDRTLALYGRNLLYQGQFYIEKIPEEFELLWDRNFPNNAE